MDVSSVKVVFMGTPDFAVPSLAAVIEAGFDVVGVVTRPEKPKGRGRKATPTPVKARALESNIKVLEPIKLDDVFMSELAALAPDLLVVVAYGKILPKSVLDVPSLGAVNLHASLLPAYRGAGPINRAIINGDNVTGTTTMFMDEGMDTGDILFTRSLEIGSDETAGELSKRMATSGAPLLVETLQALVKGGVKSTPQNNAEASLAPMLKKADGLIDWAITAVEINNRVRGFSPWPGAFTRLNGKTLKVHKGRVVEATSGAPSLDVATGVVTGTGKEGLKVACKGGEYLIEELQLEGKRRMRAGDFLRGFVVKEGESLG
jgi:methionyl-tRNA formyltransferase